MLGEGRQAVLGRFWSGRIAGAPPEDVAARAELWAFESTEAGDACELGSDTPAGDLEVLLAAVVGPVFSSRRTIYW